MRGGAQAHLLEADDGNFYVVKFRNNPQHRRILINELIATTVLEYLQIATPRTAFVNVDKSFLGANPGIHMQSGPRRIEIEAGWHFGSRFPGNPEVTAVYDFLPDPLLLQVANRGDFRSALVFDKWMGNSDGRQCIFFRANVYLGSSAVGAPGYVVQMIDNGYVFNGSHWAFLESAILGVYARKQVYGGVRSLEDFEPMLTRVMNFPEEVIDQAWKRIPPEWLEGDDDAVLQLLEQLYRRRKCVPSLLSASLSWMS